MTRKEKGGLQKIRIEDGKNGNDIDVMRTKDAMQVRALMLTPID